MTEPKTSHNDNTDNRIECPKCGLGWSDAATYQEHIEQDHVDI